MSDEVEVVQQEVLEIEQTETPQEEQQDEVEIKLGDEIVNAQDTEEKKAPAWVRELRKANRELQRQNKELKEKMVAPVVHDALKPLPKKPTLADCDYDEDKFHATIELWHEDKRKHEIEQEKQKKLQDEVNQSWQKKLQDYNTKKSNLKVADFDEAEESAMQSFSDTQKGIILQGSDDSALLVYALGKNKKRSEELAKISDPIRFAFEVAKLEKDLKVSPKSSAPAPEKVISGSARSSGTVDNTLERLREKAAKTGNMSEVLAYKRKIKQ